MQYCTNYQSPTSVHTWNYILAYKKFEVVYNTLQGVILGYYVDKTENNI
jgi:hypothetical protein